MPLPEKPCVVCGKAFVPKVGIAVVCGPVCRRVRDFEQKRDRWKSRPDVREKAREWRNRPEVRERQRELIRERRKNPDIWLRDRELQRERESKPEYKERKRERDREYCQRPEYKERRRERDRERWWGDAEYRERWKAMKQARRAEKATLKMIALFAKVARQQEKQREE